MLGHYELLLSMQVQQLNKFAYARRLKCLRMGPHCGLLGHEPLPSDLAMPLRLTKQYL